MSERDELAAVEVRRVRRKQLVNAVVHGSSRSWASTGRRWPAVLAGLVMAMILVLGAGVTQVVRNQLAQNRQQQTQQK